MMLPSLPILIISVVLFFVLFFGIGFLLNMLFRSSWIMVVLFPFIAIYFVNKAKLVQYFQRPGETFGRLGENITSLGSFDVIILSGGLAGAIGAGIVIKMLRNRGYRMF
ncbi:YuiB family protein [Peribacillus sp. SCS-155]|uniref:YuiB family protein n=1 Tax=Peribacillus sedimenti TaxID=3115297 RepID=UPI0039065A00